MRVTLYLQGIFQIEIQEAPSFVEAFRLSLFQEADYDSSDVAVFPVEAGNGGMALQFFVGFDPPGAHLQGSEMSREAHEVSMRALKATHATGSLSRPFSWTLQCLPVDLQTPP